MADEVGLADIRFELACAADAPVLLAMVRAFHAEENHPLDAPAEVAVVRVAEGEELGAAICASSTRSVRLAKDRRRLVMVDAVNPAEVWSPFGAFSMAVIQGDGQVVRLKGQVALDQQGRTVGAGDMRAQVRKVLENIRSVLASMGGRMEDVVSLVHYATDIEAFMGTGDIRKEFFAAPFPVTTTVEVARLYDPDLMVEITAVAEIPRERFRRPTG